MTALGDEGPWPGAGWGAWRETTRASHVGSPKEPWGSRLGNGSLTQTQGVMREGTGCDETPEEERGEFRKGKHRRGPR